MTIEKAARECNTSHERLLCLMLGNCPAISAIVNGNTQARFVKCGDRTRGAVLLCRFFWRNFFQHNFMRKGLYACEGYTALVGLAKAYVEGVFTF